VKKGSHLRGGNLSRNCLHFARPHLVATANRFCRPGGADFLVRKWIKAFHEAIG
jgi:hypothetical protein